MGFTQIVFRHMASSPDIGEHIRKLSGAIQERHPSIERCRAAVEGFRTQAHVHQLKVTVDLRVAGATLVASAHGPDIEPVVQAVFAELETRLRAGQPHAKVA
jgi:ribosome-associated translation inhibitor RaiA